MGGACTSWFNPPVVTERGHYIVCVQCLIGVHDMITSTDTIMHAQKWTKSCNHYVSPNCITHVLYHLSDSNFRGEGARMGIISMQCTIAHRLAVIPLSAWLFLQ